MNMIKRAKRAKRAKRGNMIKRNMLDIGQNLYNEELAFVNKNVLNILRSNQMKDSGAIVINLDVKLFMR